MSDEKKRHKNREKSGSGVSAEEDTARDQHGITELSARTSGL